MNKDHTRETVARFIREEVSKTKRLVIIAETEDGQVHTYTNHLSYAEIFALMKTADINITQEYLEQ